MQDTLPTPQHKSHRSGWLRAAVLGVNDGLVSTASLMLGVAGATPNTSAVLTAGIAGLTAGALSMAIGEYVSVSSQKDAEKADIELERASLKENPEAELAELIAIYKKRGLSPSLAKEVAIMLHEKGAVAAHIRDELGFNEHTRARPFQAAFASALAFAIGSAFPVIATLFSSNTNSAVLIVIATLFALALSGAIGAYVGGGKKLWAAGRVLIGGSLAMAITFFIGNIIGHHL